MQTKLQNQMAQFRRTMTGNVLKDAANCISDIHSRMEQAYYEATSISESAEHAGYTDLMNESDDFAHRLLELSDALRKVNRLMDGHKITDMPDSLDEMYKNTTD